MDVEGLAGGEGRQPARMGREPVMALIQEAGGTGGGTVGSLKEGNRRANIDSPETAAIHLDGRRGRVADIGHGPDGRGRAV